MPWYVLALASAVIWGFHYVMLENAMKNIHPVTALFITSISVVVLIAIYHQEFVQDVKTIMALDWKTKSQIGVLLFTGITATFCLYMAIDMKTASHAALLEIAYPVFVIIFSYLLFGLNQMSLPTLIGGALILSGSFIIVWNG